MKNENIGEINEARSITKISKELANVTSRMKELADEFYGGELGSAERVKEIKNELRELTPKKKALIQELDDSVAGKDRNIELAIEESLLSDEELLENHLNEKITVKQALRNASDALLETPQGKKFDTEYIYDYLESLERMAKKDPKSFVKDYGDFTINDYIEDVEFNLANESKLTEAADYTVIDPRGNAGAIAPKVQVQQHAKKKGGNKKGYFVVHKSNIKKAKKLYGKYGFKYSDEKLQDLMWDFMYESELNENKFDIALDKMDEWLPDNPETMERYLEIQNQEGQDDMEKFFIENGDEDVLQSFGLKQKDMKKLAKMVMNESVSEARNIQTKRKYTENHPAKTVGSSAKIRNKILEAIKDGKMHQDEFNRIVKELSSDHKRWMKRNGKMFNVSEEGVSLTRFGHTILKGITVNESFESFRNK